MLFPTVDFALFFILAFGASWALSCFLKGRKYFLLIASYVFYGWWDWRFCGLLALNALINYGAGRFVDNGQSALTCKTVLFIAVGLNLGILCVFKYLGWFLQSLSDVLFFLGLERDVPLFNLILPVGISFFTFQGISYVVDVYRQKIEAEKSFLDVALYISFFPQLVAGPIIRASDFLPQLKKKPVLTNENIGIGLVLIVVGFFKKMIIANYLATLYVDDIFFSPSSYQTLDLLFAAYAYAVQIYCDFSGYSDIAIGVAALLGFSFPQNFNQPYRASSPQDFWRRWHISLSTWLRDYLYIPLGGSRGGRWKTMRNLFITMLLGGIWHGAAWTFLIWGGIHGTALALQRVWHSSQFRLPAIFGIFITFHFVCLTWILFRSESFMHAFDYYQGLLSFNAGSLSASPFILILIVGALGFQFLTSKLVENTGQLVGRMSAPFRFALFFISLLGVLWIAPNDVAPFIYFRF